MSRVYLAEETALGRRVVIKTLPPELAHAVSSERFRQEIRFAAQLTHPNIVPLLTAGESDGLPWYSMPYLEGATLRPRLGHGPLPLAEAVSLLRDVARALAYAHEHGVVHRDIKPDNVLLVGDTALVTDFGIAKALTAATGAGQGGITTLGVVLGTPAYMAPEQGAGDPATDHRADLYAFGCLAYEVLSGAPPFAGQSPAGLIAAHAVVPPEPLAKRRPDVPPALAELVMRCLAKEAADRPQSAAEVLRGLQDLPARPRAPRRRTAAAVIAAILAILVGLGVIFSSRRSAASAGSDSPGEASPLHSVAVLPFVNTGGDPEDEYFSDGMTDELATRSPGCPTSGWRDAPRPTPTRARPRRCRRSAGRSGYVASSRAR